MPPPILAPLSGQAESTGWQNEQTLSLHSSARDADQLMHGGTPSNHTSDASDAGTSRSTNSVSISVGSPRQTIRLSPTQNGHQLSGVANASEQRRDHADLRHQYVRQLLHQYEGELPQLKPTQENKKTMLPTLCREILLTLLRLNATALEGNLDHEKVSSTAGMHGITYWRDEKHPTRGNLGTWGKS